MNRTRIPVNQAVIAPISVFPDIADAPFPFGDATAVRAQVALDCSSFEGGEIRRKLRFDQSFFAGCALEVSGKPKRYAAENMQKPAPQNVKNPRLLSRGSGAASAFIEFSG